jgi:hypothetical protein
MKPVHNLRPTSLGLHLKDDLPSSTLTASVAASTLRTRRPRRCAASPSAAIPKRSALQAQLLASVSLKRGRPSGQVKRCTQALTATTAPRVIQGKLTSDEPEPLPIYPGLDSASDTWQFLENTLDESILPQNWQGGDERPSSPPLQDGGESSRVEVKDGVCTGSLSSVPSPGIPQKNRGCLAAFAVDDPSADNLFSTVKPMLQLELTTADLEALCDPIHFLANLDGDGLPHEWLVYHEHASLAALSGCQIQGVERPNDLRAGPSLTDARDHVSIPGPQPQAATDGHVAFAAEAIEPDSHLAAVGPLLQSEPAGLFSGEVCDPLQFLPGIPRRLPFQTEQPLYLWPDYD